MSNRTLGVVILSGGMDSATCLGEARAECDLVACLHADYGQRTEARELAAFHALCDWADVSADRRLVVSLHHLATIGGSALTDAGMAMHTSGVDDTVIPTSYVPFRNAQFIAAAVAWTEKLLDQVNGTIEGTQAGPASDDERLNQPPEDGWTARLYLGAVLEDGSGYPDCRPGFYEAFQAVIDWGTKPVTAIEMVTPIIQLRKDEIVQRATALGVPLELTWSCYQASEQACGVCDSCRLRRQGFARAGLTDPLPYVEHTSNAPR